VPKRRLRGRAGEPPRPREGARLGGAARASPHRGRAESRLGSVRCSDGRPAWLGKTLSTDKSPLGLGSQGLMPGGAVALPPCRSHCSPSSTRYAAQVRHVPKRPRAQASARKSIEPASCAALAGRRRDGGEQPPDNELGAVRAARGPAVVRAGPPLVVKHADPVQRSRPRS